MTFKIPDVLVFIPSKGNDTLLGCVIWIAKKWEYCFKVSGIWGKEGGKVDSMGKTGFGKWAPTHPLSVMVIVVLDVGECFEVVEYLTHTWIIWNLQSEYQLALATLL